MGWSFGRGTGRGQSPPCHPSTKRALPGAAGPGQEEKGDSGGFGWVWVDLGFAEGFGIKGDPARPHQRAPTEISSLGEKKKTNKTPKNLHNFIPSLCGMMRLISKAEYRDTGGSQCSQCTAPAAMGTAGDPSPGDGDPSPGDGEPSWRMETLPRGMETLPGGWRPLAGGCRPLPGVVLFPPRS